MKKVLLAGTALLGVAFFAQPAAAELNLDLGGYFRGYGVFADNDVTGENDFEFRRDTELSVTGETTLDNGLTVGFRNELSVEANDLEDESYAYFSGGWGRVNFGSEDGAAYLLQVAAPSADSNVDGLRQYIDGTASSAAASAGAVFSAVGGIAGALDYDHADFSKTDRLTYLTPKFSGFQAGVSYAPESGQQAGIAAMTVPAAGTYEDLYEVSARWDGEVSGFGLSAGAGYSTADISSAPTAGTVGLATDGLDTWNVGASVGFNSFTVGASYVETNSESYTTVGGAIDDTSKETYVVGAAWDNGPYHVGASYLNTQFNQDGANAQEIERDRWAVGGGYTFGPGMTFRGAVAFGDNSTSGAAAGANDSTQVTLGTDIQF